MSEEVLQAVGLFLDLDYVAKTIASMQEMYTDIPFVDVRIKLGDEVKDFTLTEFIMTLVVS